MEKFFICFIQQFIELKLYFVSKLIIFYRVEEENIVVLIKW